MSETPDGLRARLEAGTERLSAKDGRDYVVRPIRASDAPSLIRGYDAMTDEGKYYRMLHAVPHLSPEMAGKFCAPDPATECCVVVEGRDALAEEILGGARVSDLGPGRSAEFSVSLRPEARGLGLARLALETVIEVAREAGCRRVYGVIARTNRAMLGLAERIGFRLRGDPDDLTLIIAELDF